MYTKCKNILPNGDFIYMKLQKSLLSLYNAKDLCYYEYEN